MPRVKRGRSHIKHRKNILAATKGYRWGRKSKITLAKTAALKAGRYAYRDRKNRKRLARELWLLKLNAALREQGSKYSTFMHTLRGQQILLDRKILADLAEHAKPVFHEIVKLVS